MDGAPADDRQDVLDQLPDSAYSASITPLENRVTALSLNVTTLDRNIVEIDRQTMVGEETVISLASDSLDSNEYNQELSERRAEAVADILEEVRPDLELKVEGFGEMEPVEPNEKNGEDNPEGRALDRRVEIRYES